MSEADEARTRLARLALKDFLVAVIGFPLDVDRAMRRADAYANTVLVEAVSAMAAGEACFDPEYPPARQDAYLALRKKLKEPT